MLRSQQPAAWRNHDDDQISSSQQWTHTDVYVLERLHGMSEYTGGMRRTWRLWQSGPADAERRGKIIADNSN